MTKGANSPRDVIFYFSLWNAWETKYVEQYTEWFVKQTLHLVNKIKNFHHWGNITMKIQNNLLKKYTRVIQKWFVMIIFKPRRVWPP